MRRFSFIFLDKDKIEPIINELFDILYSNMSKIAPTDDSYEDGKKIWLTNAVPSLTQSFRNIILMYADDELAGFFQYSVQSDSFMMEEIQIKPDYQGSGILGQMFHWVLERIPDNLTYVECNASKENLKAQAIYKHYGLSVTGENKTGRSWHFKGDYKTFKAHFV